MKLKQQQKNLGILSRGKVRKYVQLNFFLKSASVKSLICGCDFFLNRQQFLNSQLVWKSIFLTKDFWPTISMFRKILYYKLQKRVEQQGTLTITRVNCLEYSLISFMIREYLFEHHTCHTISAGRRTQVWTYNVCYDRNRHRFHIGRKCINIWYKKWKLKLKQNRKII